MSGKFLRAHFMGLCEYGGDRDLNDAENGEVGRSLAEKDPAAVAGQQRQARKAGADNGVQTRRRRAGARWLARWTGRVLFYDSIIDDLANGAPLDRTGVARARPG